tara:strand:+ start:250 stop:450 length:201 start_codon:yes stop_codon:yes gene_type:complete
MDFYMSLTKILRKINTTSSFNFVKKLERNSDNKFYEYGLYYQDAYDKEPYRWMECTVGKNILINHL